MQELSTAAAAVEVVRLAKIHVPPDRQRQEFDPVAHQELVDDIGTNGLIHALSIRMEGDTYVLTAGERRLRALQDFANLGLSYRYGQLTIEPGFAPVVNHGELSPLAAEELELSENIRRKDLTPQERAQATARLVKLRGETGNLAAAESVAADLYPEVARRDRIVRHELMVAAALDAGDTDVKKAKSLKEAVKIVERKVAQRANADLALLVGPTLTEDDCRLIHGECLSILVEYNGPKFDCILMDPPYGMEAHAFGDAGGLQQETHTYDDSTEAALRLMDDFAPLSIRVTKDAAHLYCFCDIDLFHNLRNIFQDAGWHVHRTPLIIHKKDGNRTPWPDHGPQRKWEMCLYAERGGKVAQRKSAPDVIETLGDDNLGHGAQKPVALYKDLLTRSCRPGDHVLDPFCGTGTIFPAAKSLLLRATGIELSDNYYGISLRRLQGL